MRLSGANYESRKIKTDEAKELVQIFSGQHPNEKRADILSQFVKCSSDTKKGSVRIIKNNVGQSIAVYGLLQEDDHQVNVEFIRIVKSKIANALFQQIIKDIIQFAVSRRFTSIVVRDLSNSEVYKSIVKSFGFIEERRGWIKFVIKGMFSSDQLISNPLIRGNPEINAVLGKIRSSDNQLSTLLKLDLERKLWPAKIIDLKIPTYIIPIRQHWAAQLFDYHSANTSLFGVPETLTWSRENVYYRNVRPVSEKAPGRILWYISSEYKSYSGRNRGIAACSYLDEVYIDRVKNVFRKYKNFGVYEWDDVYELAKHKILSDIKAIRFSETEVFEKIIPLNTINELFQEHNRPKNTFASPVEISNDLFNSIYKITIND